MDLYTMKFDDIADFGDLEVVSEAGPWQDFERLAGFIFEQHGFSVSVNTVKTSGRRRRQFDVIAKKGDRVFLAECKKWAGRRYRLSALKRAVGQHNERTAFYTGVTGETGIPVIVTLVEEEIRIYEDVPLVSIHRLNAFLAETEGVSAEALSCYFEEIISSGEEEPRVPEGGLETGGYWFSGEYMPESEE